MNLEVLKKSWLIPAIIALLLVLIVVKKCNFSFTDFIADRVIQKLNATYSPYGPNPPAELPNHK